MARPRILSALAAVWRERLTPAQRLLRLGGLAATLGAALMVVASGVGFGPGAAVVLAGIGLCAAMEGLLPGHAFGMWALIGVLLLVVYSPPGLAVTATSAVLLLLAHQCWAMIGATVPHSRIGADTWILIARYLGAVLLTSVVLGGLLVLPLGATSPPTWVIVLAGPLVAVLIALLIPPRPDVSR
ncbi:MAG: hypothetical protein Q4G40_06205 [Brachybacterium sp.]|nr:hypothetical protein [Brachybacterium sp.]